MTPEEIQKRFGKEGLEMLYDCILDRAVHELADWILAYQTENEIARWVAELRADEENDHDD
jgi:hypothetical protein